MYINIYIYKAHKLYICAYIAAGAAHILLSTEVVAMEPFLPQDVHASWYIPTRCRRNRSPFLHP